MNKFKSWFFFQIGICGASGSGKSTIANSLFGVVNIVSGKILLDEVDISTVPLDELRSRLSIIPQDVILFSGSVRENLDPRKHFSDLELWKSLEIAQLKDIITKLPNKLGNLKLFHYSPKIFSEDNRIKWHICCRHFYCWRRLNV